MLEKFEYEDFEKLVNAKFKVAGLDEDFELEFYELTERKLTDRQEIFSLFLRGPSDRFLPQMSYSLTNEQSEIKDLFLVPVGKDEKGISYQAVFNRLIKN